MKRSNFLKPTVSFFPMLGAYGDWIHIVAKRGRHNSPVAFVANSGYMKRAQISSTILSRNVFGLSFTTNDLRLREINEPMGTGNSRVKRTAKNDGDACEAQDKD